MRKENEVNFIGRHVLIKAINKHAVIIGKSPYEQSNGCFHVAIVETGDVVYFDRADFQQGLIEFSDALDFCGNIMQLPGAHWVGKHCNLD